MISSSCSRFIEHEVPYLIAGGCAVAHAGHLRATKDVDIFVPRTKAASECLAAALTEFFSATITAEETDAQFLRFYVGHPGAFDIIRKLPGVTWATAWRERSVGSFFGIQVPYLGIDTLIRNKRTVAATLISLMSSSRRASSESASREGSARGRSGADSWHRDSARS